ncbi:protocadherin gamma-C5-like [Pundamilia nyererei]|uniref:Protocadherin gamma-C5-like n=1 Tax=Pundamilia nyererei TaxID=303518 RepID=A0A9Y3VCU8_9CICH|nr:PREDICTED: protocadherin gamma-C5-like [Pundamilia nyererei]
MTKRKGCRNWRWLALWWHHFFLLWSTIDGQTRYSITEELKQGSVVGNLAKDLGLGVSEIFDRKLHVASEAGEQYFSVDAGKGELVVNDRIDREALCGQSASCVLPLQVVIEDPLQLFRVEVDIQDINDNAPRFPSNEITLEIAESTVVGVHFPLESAIDPDVGSNSLKSYTLSKDECFSIRVKEVGGGRKVPELILAKVLDREKKAVHKLLLTALDGGSPVRSGTAQITIRVLDINDNVPAFEKTSYKVSVSENAVEGALIVQTKATDMDDGQNGEIEYSFGAHTSDAMMSIFIIDHISGTIFLKGKLDFEANANYELDITAKDKGTPRMEGHCTVHVEVIDVNDNAPEIMLTSHPKPVREDSPNGTVVALISARDLDSGDNGKVRLQLPKTSQFALKPSFSHNYALVTSGPLDREKVSELNGQTRYSIPEELERGSLVGNLAKDLGLGLSDIFNRNLRVASEAGEQYFSVDAGKADGPIKYVEVLGGDMLSQSQSFRSCMSPMSEYSDFTLIKPSSTTDFKEVISVLDASLPDSTWTFESQQVSIEY